MSSLSVVILFIAVTSLNCLNFPVSALHFDSNSGLKPLKSTLSSNGVSGVTSGGGDFRGGGERGSASLTSSTFNLVKSCVGSGVLSLPAGVAAFGDSPAALVPATVVIFFLGVLSSYSFYTIGKLCQETKSSSLSEVWGKLVSEDSKWLISLSCFATPAGAAVAYSIMLGDVFSNLAKTAGLTGRLASRQASILALSTFVLYPLCNLKNLGALAPVSVIGVAGVAFTTLVMGLRMKNLVAIDTIASHLRPSFGSTNNWLSPSILVLVSMGATAYLAHFNAPGFFNELEDNTLEVSYFYSHPKGGAALCSGGRHINFFF